MAREMAPATRDAKPVLVPITYDAAYRARAWRERSPEEVDALLDRIVAEVTNRVWVGTSTPFGFSIDEARLREEMLVHLYETSAD